MRIAVPMMDDVFSRHFGRSKAMAIFEVDESSGAVTERLIRKRPRFGCESIPRWLKELGVERVIVGGLGSGAMSRLGEMGIEIVAGVDHDDVDEVLRAHLESGVRVEPTVCQHEHHEHHHCRD